MVSPVQFGAAQLEIDQSGLQHFVNRSRHYRRYKSEFLTLKDLALRTRDKLERMSDLTEIRLYGDPVRRQDLYGHRDNISGLRLTATVSTKDTELDNVVTQTVKRQWMEPLRTFWWRVLYAAQQIDKLQPATSNQSFPEVESDPMPDVPYAERDTDTVWSDLARQAPQTPVSGDDDGAWWGEDFPEEAR